MKKNLTSNFIYTRLQKKRTRNIESGQVAFTHICTCHEKLVLINQRKRMRLCSLRKKKTVIVSFVPIIAIIKYRVFFLNAKSLGTFSRRMITLTLLFPFVAYTTVEYTGVLLFSSMKTLARWNEFYSEENKPWNQDYYSSTIYSRWIIIMKYFVG